MATVYLAEDLRHDRRVAVKVLRPELAVVIGAERFLAEIRTTANLQHPHVLPLFDSGEADSFLVYVMPYVEGISLRDRMTRKKQLPIGEATRIATEIASALDYAHRHGVIHRDIKPENIMLHDGADWSYRGQDIYSFSRNQGSYEVTGSFGDAAAEMASGHFGELRAPTDAIRIAPVDWTTPRYMERGTDVELKVSLKGLWATANDVQVSLRSGDPAVSVPSDTIRLRTIGSGRTSPPVSFSLHVNQADLSPQWSGDHVGYYVAVLWLDVSAANGYRQSFQLGAGIRWPM